MNNKLYKYTLLIPSLVDVNIKLLSEFIFIKSILSSITFAKTPIYYKVFIL